MMEGEAVENLPTNFHSSPNQSSAHMPILHQLVPNILREGLCCRNQVFESLIQYQIQAFQLCLFVVFFKVGMLSLRSGWLPFYQEKGKSPSAADLYRFFIGSRGKPAQRPND
ncbi:hypothetical protein [Pedobacter sp. CFBP9032]|uniref:hypothetical protein n=1 Tax=Pedobacter sp. CFBP9032 TaxID=3096539 RepID=UPI002A6A3822|nr:hypothetical protein [Pedobacter sp. CFBP9032]MDY0903888.1 hypothetical protein [Pedobacter sp. CFBP9032]